MCEVTFECVCDMTFWRLKVKRGYRVFFYVEFVPKFSVTVRPSKCLPLMPYLHALALHLAGHANIRVRLHLCQHIMFCGHTDVGT